MPTTSEAFDFASYCACTLLCYVQVPSPKYIEYPFHPASHPLLLSEKETPEGVSPYYSPSLLWCRCWGFLRNVRNWFLRGRASLVVVRHYRVFTHSYLLP